MQRAAPSGDIKPLRLGIKILTKGAAHEKYSLCRYRLPSQIVNNCGYNRV